MVEFFDDPAERIRALVDEMEPKFRERFLAVVYSIKSSMDLEQIANLIELGRIEDAIVAAEVAALRIANLYSDVVIISGRSTAALLSDKLQIMLDFDQVNHQAVAAMQANQLRLVQEFTVQQTAATREAIIDGIQRGINPKEMAIQVRESIGLTQTQQQYVNNYRRNLERLDPNALQRALRDKRFDRTVRSAMSNDKPLTKEQMDRMVRRYEEKWLKFRAETIARTEALRSVNEGNDLMYQQAIDGGTIDPNDIIRAWDNSGDSRVRDPAHTLMQGQKRKWKEHFVSGAGNLLIRPGDINAPGSETIRCRCAVTTRFSDRAKLEAQSQVPQIVNV